MRESPVLINRVQLVDINNAELYVLWLLKIFDPCLLGTIISVLLNQMHGHHQVLHKGLESSIHSLYLQVVIQVPS